MGERHGGEARGRGKGEGHGGVLQDMTVLVWDQNLSLQGSVLKRAVP